MEADFVKKQYIGFRDLFTADNISEPLASVSKDEEKEAKRYFFHDNYDVIGFK